MAKDRSTRTQEYARFKEALLDFSDDPTRTNLARYLRASEALPAPPRRRARRAAGAERHWRAVASADGRV
jgi:hypothetical protein